MKKIQINKALSQWNDIMYILHPTPYHKRLAGIIENLRVKTIIGLSKPTRDATILEIGCESGKVMSEFKTAKNLVGMDISKQALNDAEKRLTTAKYPNIKLMLADAEKPIPLRNFEAHSFDVIICSQTLEHVRDPKSVVENIYKLANKKTKIIISVPNELFLLKIKRFFSQMGLMKTLFPGIEPTISEWHLQTFTREMVNNLIKGKFKIVKQSSVFNVYLIYLLSKK